MKPVRIFISSVQKELAEERAALRDYLRGDALMRRFFDVFLFEEVPASDRRADEVYLGEVERCDVYVGLFGNDYGFEDAEGVSPTEREFALASQLGKLRLIFVKGATETQKHPKMQALVRQAGAELIRRRFGTSAELISGLYAALVQYLEDNELIRSGPFDGAPCTDAEISDLDDERVATFLGRARRARALPLREGASTHEVLTHLSLLHHGKPTHAAVLLFGTHPQRFLISSAVKCAHFHGTQVAKPIPSLQTYKGTVFELVDQAIDFVMSKINVSVGTRVQGPQAPVTYEIPQDVVAEAIVNAVAHRDYSSNGSVQVMLFEDRLEVWNPGRLPASLTLEMLRHPHASVPANPLLAEPLYLTKYIERMGTGTEDMIRRCREHGLPDPEFAVRDGFVTTIWRKPGPESLEGQPESRPESRPESDSLENRVLGLLEAGPLAKSDLSARLGHKGISGRLKRVIWILLGDQTIELSLPEKPNSRLQKYRLTERGAALLSASRKQDRR